MDKKKRKREIIIKIGDLYDSHKDLSFVSMTNCRCEVCKEIRELGKELEDMGGFINKRIQKKYKVTVSWDKFDRKLNKFKKNSKTFDKLAYASIYVGKSKSFLGNKLKEKMFNLTVNGYRVKIEIVDKGKKESAE
ncbi:hypothetical protein [Brochothrix thermosphacta]|uniref:hypothetical protein n=1 Tax=Brochothrix thermosphacta TaxID=2756 RepID=UPI0039AFCAC8